MSRQERLVFQDHTPRQKPGEYSALSYADGPTFSLALEDGMRTAYVGEGSWQQDDSGGLVSEQRIVRVWSLHGPNPCDEVIAIVHPKGRYMGATMRGQVHTVGFEDGEAFGAWMAEHDVQQIGEWALSELVDTYELPDWGLDRLDV